MYEGVVQFHTTGDLGYLAKMSIQFNITTKQFLTLIENDPQFLGEQLLSSLSPSVSSLTTKWVEEHGTDEYKGVLEDLAQFAETVEMGDYVQIVASAIKSCSPRDLGIELGEMTVDPEEPWVTQDLEFPEGQSFSIDPEKDFVVFILKVLTNNNCWYNVCYLIFPDVDIKRVPLIVIKGQTYVHSFLDEDTLLVNHPMEEGEVGEIAQFKRPEESMASLDHSTRLSIAKVMSNTIYGD